jgi:hypothetical protein
MQPPDTLFDRQNRLGSVDAHGDAVADLGGTQTE